MTTLPILDSRSLETLEFVPNFSTNSQPKLWLPDRVLFTPAALEESHGQAIYARIQKLGVPIEELKTNRITNLRGASEKETYNRAKRTLAVTVAPPSHFKLQPIPPSADWQFHLAEGCPAHCQYCYLAGSLRGPPVVRAYANLPAILDNLKNYQSPNATAENPTTFEVSCYTDPLALEHLTGSLSSCVEYFATRPNAQLRWVSKFDRTRCRLSLNIPAISARLEGGTAPVQNRLKALRQLALPRVMGGGQFPVGVVLAPIMPSKNWRAEYSRLLDEISNALDFPCDLTFELITHRFTPGSREVLLNWYPKTKLDLNVASREEKRNKFGGVKYVYPRRLMREMKAWFYEAITQRFPDGRILYWT